MPKRVIEHLTTVSTLTDLQNATQELQQAQIEDLYDRNGEVVGIRGVRNTGIDRIVGGVGSRYAIAQNEDVVLPVAQRLQALGIEIASAKVYQAPTNMYVDILFRGSKTITPYSEEAKQALANGDIIEAGIRLQNSYTGQTPVRGGLFARRLWCANGMMTKMEALSFTKKHTANSLEDLNEALVKFVDESAEKLGHWFFQLEDSQRIPVTVNVYDVARHAGFGVRQAGKIQERFADRYEAELGHNAYSVYNAATDFITHLTDGSQQSTQGLHEKANKLLLAETYVLPESVQAE